jgi:transcriptional regulator with XRE-family HTH domain
MWPNVALPSHSENGTIRAMVRPENPATVRHRRVASELRKLRERNDLTPQQAADALGWSRPKLNKYETASRRPTVTDVEQMLNLYGCEEGLALALLKLTKNIGVRGWWTGYEDVLDSSYPELESDAVEIRSWQMGVLPGLLQIDEYALPLIRLGLPGDSSESHARRLAARAARREILTQPGAPTLHAVIDEAALRRPIGGPEAWRKQLEFLIESMEQPSVRIQVMPLKSWQHPGLDGPVVLLGFGGAVLLDVAYLEGAMGTGIYLEDVKQVTRCSVNFERISEAALSDEESKAFIRGLLDA